VDKEAMCSSEGTAGLQTESQKCNISDPEICEV